MLLVVYFEFTACFAMVNLSLEFISCRDFHYSVVYCCTRISLLGRPCGTAYVSIQPVSKLHYPHGTLTFKGECLIL